MATLPTPNDLTRQQLDELDALLQRMLSLPLSKADSAKVPPAPPLPLPDMPVPSSSRPSVSLWRADTAPASKSPHIAAEPEPALAFAPSFVSTESIARTYPTSAPAPQPAYSGGPGTLRGVDAPALPNGYPPARDHHDEESASSSPSRPGGFGRIDLAEVNPFADAPAQPQLPPPPAQSSGVPLLAWPLIACNWLIETALGWMGPLGAISRTPAIKHLLGFLGLLLLVGAGLWCAKGMCWIDWPK